MQPDNKQSNIVDSSDNQIPQKNTQVNTTNSGVSGLKKPRFGLLVIIAVSLTAIITLIIVAFIVIKPLTHKYISPEPTNKTQNTDNKPAVGLSTILNASYAVFTGQDDIDGPILMPVQVPSMNQLTISTNTADLKGRSGVLNETEYTKQLTKLTEVFKSHNFNESVIQSGINKTDYLAYYINKNAVCQVSGKTQDSSKTYSKLEVKCQDFKFYTELANKQKSMADLYPQLSASSEQYAFYDTPEVLAGYTAGYNKASFKVSSVINNQATTDGRYALYYQTPDGIWRYFDDQDNDVLLDCTKYKGQDIINVYAGITCSNVKAGAKNTVPMPTVKK